MCWTAPIEAQATTWRTAPLVARGGVNLIHVVATSSNSLNWWFGTPLSSPTSEKIGILNTGSQVPYDYGGLVGFRKIYDLFG